MIIRRATVDDVVHIVRLYAADDLNGSRENADDLDPYLDAFAALDADPDNFLAVVELDGEIVGTFQLTVIPGVLNHGMSRGLIEAVHVRPDRRGHGIGATMIRWAVDEAKRRGCALVQLTSSSQRPEAHRFYERLGFEATHKGFKLYV